MFLRRYFFRKRRVNSLLKYPAEAFEANARGK
jgi:hypothetical protein